MTSTVKLHLLLLIYYITCIDISHGKEIIITEDKPYEVINISIPRQLWKQALHRTLRPTPILKSPVTITVPIHVAQEEEDEHEDEIVNETVAENEENDATPGVVNDEEVIQEPISAAPVEDEVTQSPILNEEDTPTEGDVTGQVQRFPCTCSGQCGCCTGAILQRFDMKACGNISFVPEDFVFDVRLTVNNNTVVRRRVSASDPPPICFNPRRAPFVRVCAEISNIRIRNRNAFACLDIKADIGGFQIYSASFRCFGLGSKGVQTGLKPKPVSSGPKPVNLFGGNSDGDRGSLLENAASSVISGGSELFGGSNGGLFGGSNGGLFGGSNGGLFGGSNGGLFGGGGGSENEDDDNGGPLDAIGDAVGDIFDGRNLKDVLW